MTLERRPAGGGWRIRVPLVPASASGRRRGDATTELNARLRAEPESTYVTKTAGRGKPTTAGAPAPDSILGGCSIHAVYHDHRHGMLLRDQLESELAVDGFEDGKSCRAIEGRWCG